MGSTTTKEDLYTMFKLEADGRNWVIFKNRFEWALAMRGVVDHLTGAAAKPMPPRNNAKPDEIADYEKALAELQKPEFICRQQLACALPNSLLWKILHNETVAKMWKTITTEYELKTSLVQADLRAKFQNLSCSDKGDLRAHLDKL